MRKILLPTLILVGLGLAFSGFRTGAAETASVTATVTAQNVSVTVADGTVTYGTTSLGSSKNTVALSDTQTATNAGNVTSQLNIKGQNSTAWTLAGTAGSDIYVHKFCTFIFNWDVTFPALVAVWVSESATVFLELPRLVVPYVTVPSATVTETF